jgi:signal transduction histidine kinase
MFYLGRLLSDNKRQVMAARQLKNQFLVSMFVTIGAMSVSIAILGFYVIKADIMDRAQRQVRDNLKAAHSFYQSEIEKIENAFELVSFNEDVDSLRRKMNLHYLQCVLAADIDKAPSEIVKAAFESCHGVSGTRIMTEAELTRIDSALADAARILIKPTPMALPTDRKQLDSVIVKEYAAPILDSQGRVEKVYYGGRIINRDYGLVDKIQLLVFGNEQYHSKPVGTVTIFQDDTRISTNVLDENGQRAVGTRVSAQVYKEVVKNGNTWDDRAFVVNAWYKTAYEPIKNIHGRIIGILYVGTLAEPFDTMARRITLVFIAIVAGATVLAAILSFVLAGGISRSLAQMLRATKTLSRGDLGYVVKGKTGVTELDDLVESFNEMSAKLQDRDKSLNLSNEMLAELNKRYVDLIGFVSHELKGIIASIVMNVHAVRDNFLGSINEKQKRALDGAARSLDYLTDTVKKFLSLGKIETGDLKAGKADVQIRKDVFDIVVNSLAAVAERKNITIRNEIAEDLTVHADPELMRVAVNNLISNAIKYGTEDGTIILSSLIRDGYVQIEIYNDSTPIHEHEKSRLFERFSRLDNPATRSVKGTGLGLFITKQIIAVHGGEIWVEPREKGNSFIFQLAVKGPIKEQAYA